ncbi:MAG: glycine--tRNA ligase subunit beta, partial [Chromatiales bacterium]|nr:glycine--tRNA ligase subunit beta [Chromatiales bacterium]
MAEQRDFLVEIGTEELPPKDLKRLSAAFEQSLVSEIARTGLDHGPVHSFATPRRLAVRIDALATRQPARKLELRGPPLKIAFDADGNPTRAAEAFASKCGVDVGALG